jgi:alpha/beta superfamily hydrolase
MPEVAIKGEAGRLEGEHAQGAAPDAPLALVLHPHPLAGGEMDNPVVTRLFRAFEARGFSVLRFNFRGVGASQGAFDGGAGELADAVAALAWLQATSPASRQIWIAGYSFGSWIGAQLTAHTPGVDGFIAVSPPAGHYDFSFLAAVDTLTLVLHGSADDIAPAADVGRLAAELAARPGGGVDYQLVEGASHFWAGGDAELSRRINAYLDKRLVD